MGRRKKKDGLAVIRLEIEKILWDVGQVEYPAINKEETGLRLRELIEQRGFTIKDVQKYLGLACVQSIYHWIEGRKLPSVDNLYALSSLLQVPMDSLVRGNRKGGEEACLELILRRIKVYEAFLGKILCYKFNDK